MHLDLGFRTASPRRCRPSACCGARGGGGSPAARPSRLANAGCAGRWRRPCCQSTSRSKKSPPSRSRAGQEGGVRCYLLIRYVRSPPSGLKDSTWYPAFFIAPAMNPRTVCPCHPIVSMISASVAPFFRWSMATTWAVLLPSRGPAVSCALAAFLALGAFLAAVAFLPALPLTGAPLAPCAPPLALRFAFGSGLSAFGFSGSPSFWMRSQMRPTAALALLNPFTGVTPGRLFQMATRRSAGQLAACFASSFWLLKESEGVVVAAASSAEPNAVMLLSLS